MSEELNQKLCDRHDKPDVLCRGCFDEAEARVKFLEAASKEQTRLFDTANKLLVERFEQIKSLEADKSALREALEKALSEITEDTTGNYEKAVKIIQQALQLSPTKPGDGKGEGLDSKKLMERLADIEHQRWSRWHKHAVANWLPGRVELWNQLANTSYSELSEELKEKDRVEVRKYLEVIRESLKGREGDR